MRKGASLEEGKMTGEENTHCNKEKNEYVKEDWPTNKLKERNKEEEEEEKKGNKKKKKTHAIHK